MRSSLQYCIMDNIYRSIFSLVLLKIFWNFWNSSIKKSTFKQPFSGVYKIDALKKFSKFTKKHQCWSHSLQKSLEKDSSTGVFLWILRSVKEHLFYRAPPVEFEFAFYKVLRLGVHKKVFEWLAVNKFLSNSMEFLHPNSKNYLCYLHFLFLHFLYNHFFPLMKILDTLAWKNIHSIKLSGSGNQKVFLFICWRNI